MNNRSSDFQNTPSAGHIYVNGYGFVNVDPRFQQERSIRKNAAVTGLALTIFGTGAGQFLGEYMRVQEGSYVSLSNNLKAIFVNSPFPAFLRNIPVLGPLLFQHNILTYFALALAIFLAWFLNKTRKGLYLRAVGESPATADAAVG